MHVIFTDNVVNKKAERSKQVSRVPDQSYVCNRIVTQIIGNNFQRTVKQNTQLLCHYKNFHWNLSSASIPNVRIPQKVILYNLKLISHSTSSYDSKPHEYLKTPWETIALVVHETRQLSTLSVSYENSSFCSEKKQQNPRQELLDLEEFETFQALRERSRFRRCDDTTPVMKFNEDARFEGT